MIILFVLWLAGLRWSERKSYCLNIPNVNERPIVNLMERYVSFQCVVPLDAIYKAFIALWIGYFVLAVYFDNVITNEYGVRR